MRDKKIFRCPIHELIEVDKESILLPLINSREFQRLRRIKQLGLAGFTYPSAVHDRFSHSLGVMHLAGKLVEYLNLKDERVAVDTVDGPIEIDRLQLKTLIQVTALLHDIGHGPFSHAFEKVTNTDHEIITTQLIDNDHGEIKEILDGINDPILKKYLRKWVKDILTKSFSPIWVGELITSQLDADRMDYLKRDAYMCGVSYASFDIEWLIRNMVLREIKSENRTGLVINASKGLSSAESFLISRYHMYWQVYFHKTTRGYEALMRKILERFSELLNAGELGSKKVDILGEELYNFFESKSINSYLELDDMFITVHIIHWSKTCEDRILKELCRCYVSRDVFKMFHEAVSSERFSISEFDKINDCFSEKKDRDYFYFTDSPANTALKDEHSSGKKTAEKAEIIWVVNGKNRVVDIADESKWLAALRNQIEIKTRYYMKRDIFEKNKTELLSNQIIA